MLLPSASRRIQHPCLIPNRREKPNFKVRTSGHHGESANGVAPMHGGRSSDHRPRLGHLRLLKASSVGLSRVPRRKLVGALCPSREPIRRLLPGAPTAWVLMLGQGFPRGRLAMAGAPGKIDFTVLAQNWDSKSRSAWGMPGSAPFCHWPATRASYPLLRHPDVRIEGHRLALSPDDWHDC